MIQDIEDALNYDLDPHLADEIVMAYMRRRLTREQAFDRLVEYAGVNPEIAQAALDHSRPETLH